VRAGGKCYGPVKAVKISENFGDVGADAIVI